MNVAGKITLPPHSTISLSAAQKLLAHWQSRWLYEGAICERLAAGSLVVSVGEGTGEYMTCLASRFPRLEFAGFDLDPNRVQVATELARRLNLDNVRFERAEATRLPVRGSTADLVYCKQAFQVLPDKTGALREMERIAAGVVYLSEIPNHPYCAALLRAFALRSRTYRTTTRALRVTEDYLRQIGAFHSGLWYLRLIRRQFPDARMVGTYVLASNLERVVRFPLLGTHVGFQAICRSHRLEELPRHQGLATFS